MIEKLFPDVYALVGCPQEPAWHPEGDVWIHTLQAVDLAAGYLDGLGYPRQVVVMLGTLCHDLGKPPTTKVIDGRIRSLDHEEQGIAPTTRVLDRLNLHTLDGYDVRKQVIAIVADHLKPGLFYRERDKVGDAAFRRLALKCELDLLYRVAKADTLGRVKEGAPPPSSEGPTPTTAKLLRPSLTKGRCRGDSCPITRRPPSRMTRCGRVPKAR